MDKLHIDSKLPPQAIDVEEIVLGSMMLEKFGLIEAMNLITENTFYKEAHQKIFSAISNLFNNSLPVDIITVTKELEKQGNLELIGGGYYISQLTGKIASSANTVFHCVILKQKELKRKQIEIGSNLIQKAYDETEDCFDTNDYLTTESIKAAGIVDISQIESNSKIINRIRKRIYKASQEKGLTGIATGFNKIDSIIGGYQDSDLIIKAARPGMGKTAHALCEALHAALIEDKKVLFFSLEMSKDQLMTRLISMKGSFDSENLRTGTLTDSEWTRFDKVESELSVDNLIIIDDVYDINSIVNKSKKISLEKGVDIIFVDYLQLIGGVQTRNREQEVSGISRSLKMMAKNINVPVVALSQLSRGLETRGGDKKPLLSDLRDSGAIEQDADIVTFLYRPSYYGIKEDVEKNPISQGYTLFMISKHRNGSLEDVPLEFIGRYTRFENIGEYNNDTLVNETFLDDK